MEEARDPQAFLKFELDGWETSVSAYRDGFSPLTRQTIPAILDALGSLSGKRILDVACGPGDLSKALAEKGAIVTAVDFAPAMIERAQLENDRPNIHYEVGNAETLSNFTDDSFDAVVMNYGILHLGRPVEAMKAAARVLRPGGRFVFSCWQDSTKARGFAVILDAVKRVGATPEGMPHGPNFFDFSNDENIRVALSTAGFSEMSIRDVDQTWLLNDGEALFDAFLHGTARTGGMLKKLSPDDLLAVRKLAVETAHGEFETADGTLAIPMPTKVARGDLGL